MDFLLIILGIFTFLVFAGIILYMVYDYKNHNELINRVMYTDDYDKN